MTAQAQTSGYARLEDQIAWYDGRSLAAQRTFRALKIVQIVVAAAIPVVSLLNPTDAVIPGALGAAILILEGVQELGMYRQNWQKYRSSCEALRHEKYLYMAGAGPFVGLSDDDARLPGWGLELFDPVRVLLRDQHLHPLCQQAARVVE